jgi:hypothetical protein
MAVQAAFRRRLINCLPKKKIEILCEKYQLTQKPWLKPLGYLRNKVLEAWLNDTPGLANDILSMVEHMALED